jgi:hypothetical protein
MSKTKWLIALTGFVVAAAVAVPVVEAYPYPEGDCPGNEHKGGGWDLIKIKKAKHEHKAKKVDAKGNCDKWVCELITGNGSAMYKDNNK